MRPPATAPLWFDCGGIAFWQPIFAAGVIIGAIDRELRRRSFAHGGATSVYCDLHLNNRVGTPSAPADPSLDRATGRNKFFDNAAAATGCATPVHRR